MTGAVTSTRVLIDATSASIGGGYTYLVNVVPRLATEAPDCRFRVLVRHRRIFDAIEPRPNLEVVKLPAAGILERLRYIYFSLSGEARRFDADLFFSVGEMAPPRLPCPSIASFRNACVFAWGLVGMPLRDRLRLNALWALSWVSSRCCDRILFVSHDSARWIGDSLRLPQPRRAVVHHGIDAASWSDATPTQHPRPYILSVGSIYTHKNLVCLIDAWVALAERHPEAPDLILIGDSYDAGHERDMRAARAAAGALGERIHILGGVAHEEVRSYLAGAALFAFPSVLETFGHPLLEAMAAGVPLVASDIPVFREIAGDAALYAEPRDAHALSRALEAALVPETSADLVRRGSERVRGFGIDRTVRELLVLFDRLVESPAARAEHVPQAG